MGFFDDLGKNITKGVNTISSTGKETAEQLKLRNTISNAQRMIQKQYADIGEMFYNCAKGNIPDADYSEAIRIIDEQNAIIESSNARIEILKNTTICPNCGTKVEPDTKFCPRCGIDVTIQPAPAPEPAPAPAPGNICPVCGAPTVPGSKFCINCGTKLEEAVVETPPVINEPVEKTADEAPVVNESIDIPVAEAPVVNETIEEAIIETAEEITETHSAPEE